MTSDPADSGPDSAPDVGAGAVPDAEADDVAAHGSEGAGEAGDSCDLGPDLDVDAAFAEIVARWEPSSPGADDAEPIVVRRERTPMPEPVRLPVSEPADEDDEITGEGDHFVPPPPPPLPTVEPRRKLAWIGLVGAPVLALLFIALGVVVPGWMALFMVAAFVGGFGYLVATMGSSPSDPWSGDDGAIL
jgi:hypothetical protein